MSYILDALTKSEEQRQREKTATPLQPASAIPPTLPRSHRGHTKWYVLTCICLLLTGAGYYFFPQLFFNSVKTPPQEIISHTKPPQAATPNKEVPAQKDFIPETQLQPEYPSQTVIRAEKKKIVLEKPKLPPPSVDVLQPSPIAVDAPVPLPSPPVYTGNVPYLEQLDTGFQKSVPKFKLAGHVYSDNPQLRLILINNSIVRENDVVERDFIVDEIIPNGIILRTGETRFRLDAD